MMTTTTTKYDIRLLSNGDKIGTCELTAAQVKRYDREAQWPEGAITLADLMGATGTGDDYDHLDVQAVGDRDMSKVVVYLELA